MLVCNVCGSRNILLEPRENHLALLNQRSADIVDFYWCNNCDDESQPIEDPHEKGKIVCKNNLEEIWYDHDIGGEG